VVATSSTEAEYVDATSGCAQFCGLKGIKREFSVPRTPQQNGIAERKNKTLIEAARTLLADSLLPILFWAEAVNTACYVQNRVLVTKPHNKTPYELLHGRLPSIGFMRPFGCPVTILNTLDHLGKFQGKVDEGFLVGYSVCSFQDTEKAGEEGTHTYVLFPVLSDGSTNSQNNNKDALVDGKEHDDNIQKSVEGIEYDKVFAPVARIKAIGPPGFEDPKNPNKVYKVVKAIYGLHQAPRAWYETLATYLLENGFKIGTIDQTLFIKKQQKDILLVQIYVDDIIFGKSASTPIDAEKPLLKDSDGEDVDVHTY
nr:ribonuclease H-like domain-containing protein [Tanacetum cinerariifolium]